MKTSLFLFITIFGTIFLGSDPKIKIIDATTGIQVDTCDCNLAKSINLDVSFIFPAAVYSFDKVSINLFNDRKLVASSEWTKSEFAAEFPNKSDTQYKLKFIKADVFSKKYDSNNKSSLTKPGAGQLKSEDLCKLGKSNKTIDDAFAKREDVYTLKVDITGHTKTGYIKTENGDGTTTSEPEYGKETQLLVSSGLVVVQPKKK